MSIIYEDITFDLDKITDEYMRRVNAATGELMDEKLASIGYVKVVRCMDCVSSYRDEDGMWCCFHGTGFYRKPTDEDNYCSKGKRRDA